MDEMAWESADDASSLGTWSRRRLSPPLLGIVGVSRHAPSSGPARLRRLSTLDRYVRLINDGTLLHAVALELAGTPPAVATQLSGQLSSLSAAFVIGLDAPDAAEVSDQVAEAGGPLIVSFTDAVTTVHAAAVLAALEPLVVVHRARVALADASACPLLGPILVGSGVAELTFWHTRDASAYPYRRLCAEHDVVINPDPSASLLEFGDFKLRLPDPVDLAALVVPGLFGALCGHGIAVSGVEHLVAAAQGIAAVTPMWETLPGADKPLLPIRAIARHVDAAVNRPHQ